MQETCCSIRGLLYENILYENILYENILYENILYENILYENRLLRVLIFVSLNGLIYGIHLPLASIFIVIFQ